MQPRLLSLAAILGLVLTMGAGPSVADDTRSGNRSCSSGNNVRLSTNTTSSETHRHYLGLTPFGGHRLSGLVCRCGEPVLEGYRVDLAERGVAPAAVVDGLDPGADRGDRGGVGGEVVPVVELGL